MALSMDENSSHLQSYSQFCDPMPPVPEYGEFFPLNHRLKRGPRDLRARPVRGSAALAQRGTPMSEPSDRWRKNGVRIIRAGELSSNTPQTPGMQRRAAVTSELT